MERRGERRKAKANPATARTVSRRRSVPQRRSVRPYPTLLLVEWLRGPRVRLFFTGGKISEVDLPIRSAKNVRIVYGGVGLNLGGHREISAATLHDMPGKVWRRSRWPSPETA